MKKKYFKKAKKLSKKISMEQVMDENKKGTLSFSLTQKETKRYNKWLKRLWDDMSMDDTEDCYVFYPEFQFSPFELGVRIQVSVGNNTLLLRSAWEDDEVKCSL